MATDERPVTQLDARVDDLVRALTAQPDLGSLAIRLDAMADMVDAAGLPPTDTASTVWRHVAAVAREVQLLKELKKEMHDGN